jgi:subtilisin family serine protease
MQSPAHLWSSLAVASLASTSVSFAQEHRTTATTLNTEAEHRLAVQRLESNPSLEFDERSVLVRFAPGTDELVREELRMLVGRGRLVQYRTVDDLELIDCSIDVQLAIQLLAPHVKYAEPNWIQRVDSDPNDTYYYLQWGMTNTGQTIQGSPGANDADIDAPEAWNITTGDPNLVIAIIDTGTDWDHPDLAANIWSNPGEVVNGIDDDGNGYVDDVRGWDFYSVDSNPDDSDGHGSHTAGTVGAVGNNNRGVSGVMWQCKMAPLRFLGPQGGFTSDSILAVEYCTINNIRLSNNSWGGGGFSSSVYDAIDASRSIGHVFVAAAGNDGTNNDNSPHYPSNYDLSNIISVAATDNQDGLANEGSWGSNYGANTVDIGAPGVDIASTYMNAGYVWLGGTSMATPHVCGVAGLVISQNPGWTYTQVVNRILSTARPTSALAGKCTTGGMLNAFDAVNTGGPPADTTPPAAPSGLSASAGNGSVSLNWSNNGESDLGSYSVYRSTNSGSGHSQIASGIGSSAYSDNSANNGTTYYYVVTATDTSGNESQDSSEVSATPTAPADTTPPAAPTGLSASGGNGSVSLDWDNSSAGDLDAYSVYRSTSSGGSYGLVASGVGSSDYVDNGVSNGTAYYYLVTATDTSGNESSDSSIASATPTAPPTGGQPVTLFSDGFESGDFSAGNWAKQNTKPRVHTGADRTGTYGARLKRTTWIEVMVSTAGVDNIEVSYSRRTKSMDSGEALYAEYWNGSAWIQVEATNSTSWGDQNYALGADADDNGAFKLRFRTDANQNRERADVDDIVISGTTL